MKKLWIISLLFLFLVFNTGSVSGVAYRIIVNKLPMLPQSNTTRNGIVVQNNAECQTYCKDSRNYMFANGIGGQRCLCSNDSKPFRYGLVSSPGAVFKSEVRDVRGIDFFIYMGIKPIESDEIAVTNIHLVRSMDSCALLCYDNKNMQSPFCLAFSYDVDPVAKQPCRIFAKPKQGTLYDVIPTNSTLMYFGKVGPFLTKFSRQWGLLTPATSYKARKDDQPSRPTGNRPYYLTDLESCATRCYEEFEYGCDHLYYDIVKERCYVNSLPTDVNRTSMFDPNFMYFRQDRTKDCSATPLPLFSTSGIFRSPGFPYSYDTEPCSWKFLTPWGSALSVKMDTALPQRDVCQETIQINNVSERICKTEKQIVGQSDNGVNTVELKPSQNKSDGFAFVAEYESVIACRPGRQQLLLQGSGMIGTPNYPNPMKPSVCSWKISASAEKEAFIYVNDMDFTSEEPMLKSATLRLSDAKGTSILCNSTNNCIQLTIYLMLPVVVDFQSGEYFQFPSGFLLSYSFDEVFPKADIRDTIKMELNAKGQTIEEMRYDLQLSRKVYLLYEINNTIKDPRFKRIVLTLDAILLGERSTDSNHRSFCSDGYVTITDTAINDRTYSYMFCNHMDNGTRIISNGNTLTVNVVIPPQSYLPTSIPPKSIKFSVTNYEDTINRNISLNASSLTFTSPNYPKNYPPNENIRWSIANASGKVAVLSFLDVNLGRYQVLTNYFCNNDRLVIHIGAEKKVFNCSITQRELPMRFVQHESLAVVLITSEQYLGLGFKANVEYYNKVGCNKTSEPVVIQSAGPILSARYSNSSAGPCQWRLDKDLVIDCLEGCDQVKFIEPSGNSYSGFGSKYSRNLFKGTIVQWRGNEIAEWFSALVSDIRSSTSAPTPGKSTFYPTTLHSTTSRSGEVLPAQSSGSLSVGAIVGIVIGILSILIAITVVTLLLLFRRPGYDIQIVDSIRSSFANMKNPFARRSEETTSSYKSFVDDDTSNSINKDEIAVKYRKEEYESSVDYEVKVSDYVSPGHLQIGGLHDTNTANS